MSKVISLEHAAAVPIKKMATLLMVNRWYGLFLQEAVAKASSSDLSATGHPQQLTLIQ